MLQVTKDPPFTNSTLSASALSPCPPPTGLRGPLASRATQPWDPPIPSRANDAPTTTASWHSVSEHPAVHPILMMPPPLAGTQSVYITQAAWVELCCPASLLTWFNGQLRPCQWPAAAMPAAWVELGRPASLFTWFDGQLLPCQWQGITCDPTQEFITGIDLTPIDSDHLHWPSRTFVGSVPRLLHLLTTLEVIALPSWDLKGSLPTSWSALTKLTRLDLSDNVIGSTLPHEWGELSEIEVGN
eukprot:gene11895-14996_t